MVPELKKIRVEFSKTGALKYISHLDLNRTVQTSFLRSKLPIWYTQGFNPHPKTVFSPPLSVGVSSECEFMDFKMTEEVPYDEICRKLNESFPDGIRILSAYEPETKFSDIGWADYEIAFEAPQAEAVKNDVAALFSGEINVEKTGKAGTRTVDIAPNMRLISCTAEGEMLTLRIMLSCKELTFVGPNLPVKYIADKIPALSESEVFICRKAVYFDDGKTLFR